MTNLPYPGWKSGDGSTTSPSCRVLMREGVKSVDPSVLWHFQELFKRAGWLAERQLKLESQMASVEDRLQTISNQLAAIQQSLSGLEGQPSTRIDKIEYNFEQLKIDTLSGTLQIGLSHDAKGLIEDLQAADADAQSVQLGEFTQDGQPFARASAALQDYFGVELHRDIDQAAEQAGIEADVELHARIAEDLDRQAQQRLLLYTKELPGGGPPDEATAAQLVERIKGDIRSGLASFFKKE